MTHTMLHWPGARRRIAVPAFLALLFCLQLLIPSFAAGQEAPEGQASQGPPVLPDVVARVNGEEIVRRELLAQAQNMREQATEAGAGDPGMSKQFLTMVLDAMISERLVYADSKSRGVGPSEAAIEERVQGVIAQYGGEDGFEKALEAQGLDRDYVRKQIVQTMSFDHMMNNEIKPSIEIGDEAVAAYYERFKEQMKIPMLYKVRRIMKRVPGNGGEEALQAARTQLEALRQQLAAGADFAALAKEHSEDEGTRDNGGEVPWFPLTGQGGSLETLIAELEVGQVSEVVETRVGDNTGLFLLRLDDRQPERLKTLEEASPEIVNTLAVNEARRVIQGRIQSLRADAKVEILM